MIRVLSHRRQDKGNEYLSIRASRQARGICASFSVWYLEQEQVGPGMVNELKGLPNELWPVIKRSNHHTGVYEVELAGELPIFFAIIDLESAVFRSANEPCQHRESSMP